MYKWSQLNQFEGSQQLILLAVWSLRVFSIKGPEKWGVSLEGSLVTYAPLPLPHTASYFNPFLI